MTVWARITTSNREHEVVGGFQLSDVQEAIAGGPSAWKTVPVQLMAVVEVNPAHIVYVFETDDDE